MRFCDAELGKIEERRNIIDGHRHTTTTTYCKDCIENNEPVKQRMEEK